MILHLEQLEDPRLVPYRHVGDHRWLSARGLFVAEGRLLVRRAIEAHRFAIDSVIMTRPAFAAMEDLLQDLAAPVFVLQQPALDELAGFPFHRGCLALVRRPEPLGIEELARVAVLLGLEAIGNPDNVGGLFRIAAAFGAGGIVLDGSSGDPFYRKAVRTSMGAVFALPIARIEEWPASVAAIRRRGFTTVALTPQPDAMPLEELAAARGTGDRLLLLVGGEGSGLGPSTMAAADHRVWIPIAAAVDSLNVTVAAAVALYRLGPGRTSPLVARPGSEPSNPAQY